MLYRDATWREMAAEGECAGFGAGIAFPGNRGDE
jgi:hypothetical protein